MLQPDRFVEPGPHAVM